MPKVKEILFGTSGKNKQLPTLTPEQQELFKLIQQGLQSGEGSFKDIFGEFNQEGFNKGVRDPALKDFEENIIPSLTEKFTGGGQLRGSGYQRTLAKAGTDLQSKLAQMLYQAQQGHNQNRSNAVQNLLNTKASENLYQKPTTGVIPAVAQELGAKAGTAAGTAIAG